MVLANSVPKVIQGTKHRPLPNTVLCGGKRFVPQAVFNVDGVTLKHWIAEADVDDGKPWQWTSHNEKTRATAESFGFIMISALCECRRNFIRSGCLANHPNAELGLMVSVCCVRSQIEKIEWLERETLA